MTGEVISMNVVELVRVSMNAAEFFIIVGLAFGVGALLALWIGRR